MRGAAVDRAHGPARGCGLRRRLARGAQRPRRRIPRGSLRALRDPEGRGPRGGAVPRASRRGARAALVSVFSPWVLLGVALAGDPRRPPRARSLRPCAARRARRAGRAGAGRRVLPGRRGRRVKGRRVVVWGLGVFGGGAAAARVLAERGARVRVLDRKPPSALAPSLRALEGSEVELVLGREHRAEDFAGADLVVKSPAIPPRSPWIAWLEERRVPLTSELALGLAELETPYAVVTGSKGKSTTATLLGEMVREAFGSAETVGNNERPLLELVASRRRPARVVVEVSSFMAEGLARARVAGARFRAPEVCVFTSLGPEHLDWHGGLEDYYEAKLSLLGLGPRAVASPAGSEELEARLPGRLGSARWLRSGREQGAGLAVEWTGEEARSAAGALLFRRGELSLLGEHNLENALVAASGALALGVAPEAVRRAVRAFRPLPHRLETVAVSPQGIRFVNDSMATTPAAAKAALAAVEGPLVVLLGGSDKGARYEELAEAAAGVHSVVCLGEIGGALARALRAAVAARGGGAEVVHVRGGFEEAFRAGLERCPPGGALLLAPATASYDMFPNFKARGERFRALAVEAARP
ncbi:MAG: UDP-N-acetylmuramoyl-L-alanine--D-glutamate ligase [Planctomycetota bacterium]|nr:MAG: UDP-N-acetylmuramoyl-L-alanine--D-glutamate ligase [Planctomycetota bacterium]